MRCQDCDRNLTDEESTLWNEKTNDYWDLCNECLGNFYRDTDVGCRRLDTDWEFSLDWDIDDGG